MIAHSSLEVATLAALPQPLPARAVLLHIGPPKTGTTAIQWALFEARPQLDTLGVLHAGSRNPIAAVQALRGKPFPNVGYRAPRIRDWDRLVAQVHDAADKRVVVSCEHFADTDMETARRAVTELGGSRVHVLITLRPLTKMMPSQWQQYVRNQFSVDYEDRLDGMLRRPPFNKPTPTFWYRNRHDELVERWCSIVGPERVTVIVLDESDPNLLLRTFEALVDIPQGLLKKGDNRRNRSLTRGEIELIRQMNIEFKRQGWSGGLYKQLVVGGIDFRLRTGRLPEPDERVIETPRWALERAAEIGAAAAVRIAALGVEVIGDLSILGSLPDSGDDTPDTVPVGRREVSVAAAREALIGAIIASDVLKGPRTVDGTSTRDLQRVVLQRLRLTMRRQVRRRWRRLRRTH
jgi:hypothetical protein